MVFPAKAAGVDETQADQQWITGLPIAWVPVPSRAAPQAENAIIFIAYCARGYCAGAIKSLRINGRQNPHPVK
jgi:hypothetical protein